MYVSRLRLRNFRNYARLDAEFDPGVHFFVGPNAQGKSNLIEAIYVLSTLRSFRGAKSSELVRHGAAGFFVGGEIVSTARYVVRYFWSKNQRKLLVNNEHAYRVADYFGTLRAVVVSPQDIQLIEGQPLVRRRFLDLLLAYENPQYLLYLQGYREALLQRNSLLKVPNLDYRLLKCFSEQLIHFGTLITQLRAKAVERLCPLVQQICSMLGTFGAVKITYRPSAADDFSKRLEASIELDRRYGQTQLGPHRDELLIEIDRLPADRFASTGQKRAIAIALKLAQAQYLTESYGTPPVLLIDDVGSELDPERRRALAMVLEKTYRPTGQVFLTTTDRLWASQWPSPATVWIVESGSLRRSNE